MAPILLLGQVSFSLEPRRLKRVWNENELKIEWLVSWGDVQKRRAKKRAVTVKNCIKKRVSSEIKSKTLSAGGDQKLRIWSVLPNGARIGAIISRRIEAEKLYQKSNKLVSFALIYRRFSDRANVNESNSWSILDRTDLPLLTARWAHRCDALQSAAYLVEGTTKSPECPSKLRTI